MQAPALGHSLPTWKGKQIQKGPVRAERLGDREARDTTSWRWWQGGKAAGEGIMEVESVGIKEWSPSKGRGRGDSRPRKQFAHRHDRTVREGIKGEAWEC